MPSPFKIFNRSTTIWRLLPAVKLDVIFQLLLNGFFTIFNFPMNTWGWKFCQNQQWTKETEIFPHRMKSDLQWQKLHVVAKHIVQNILDFLHRSTVEWTNEKKISIRKINYSGNSKIISTAILNKLKQSKQYWSSFDLTLNNNPC